MKKMIFVLLLTLSLFAYLVGKKEPEPISKYQDYFNATCRIKATPHPMWGASMGSGILLDTGYILTNRHVVDSDNNGMVENRERPISIEFFGDTSYIYSATVVSKIHNYDLALVKPMPDIKSKIKLATNQSYSRVLLGEPLMAIGSSSGDEPHLTMGIRSNDISRSDYHRSSVPIFFGNSGGGLFSIKSGELIGINTRLRIYRGRMAPGWSEYMPAPIIRKFLEENGYAADVVEEKNNNIFYIFTSITIILGLLTSLWIFGYAIRR